MMGGGETQTNHIHYFFYTYMHTRSLCPYDPDTEPFQQTHPSAEHFLLSSFQKTIWPSSDFLSKAKSSLSQQLDPLGGAESLPPSLSSAHLSLTLRTARVRLARQRRPVTRGQTRRGMERGRGWGGRGMYSEK